MKIKKILFYSIFSIFLTTQISKAVINLQQLKNNIVKILQNEDTNQQEKLNFLQKEVSKFFDNSNDNQKSTFCKIIYKKFENNEKAIKELLNHFGTVSPHAQYDITENEYEENNEHEDPFLNENYVNNMINFFYIKILTFQTNPNQSNQSWLSLIIQCILELEN
ncbi:MAG: hypothetical protein ABIA74_04335 [bacterium]